MLYVSLTCLLILSLLPLLYLLNLSQMSDISDTSANAFGKSTEGARNRFTPDTCFHQTISAEKYAIYNKSSNTHQRNKNTAQVQDMLQAQFSDSKNGDSRFKIGRQVTIPSLASVIPNAPSDFVPPPNPQTPLYQHEYSATHASQHQSITILTRLLCRWQPIILVHNKQTQIFEMITLEYDLKSIGEFVIAKDALAAIHTWDYWAGKFATDGRTPSAETKESNDFCRRWFSLPSAVIEPPKFLMSIIAELDNELLFNVIRTKNGDHGAGYQDSCFGTIMIGSLFLTDRMCGSTPIQKQVTSAHLKTPIRINDLFSQVLPRMIPRVGNWLAYPMLGPEDDGDQCKKVQPQKLKGSDTAAYLYFTIQELVPEVPDHFAKLLILEDQFVRNLVSGNYNTEATSSEAATKWDSNSAPIMPIIMRPLT